MRVTIITITQMRLIVSVRALPLIFVYNKFIRVAAASIHMYVYALNMHSHSFTHISNMLCKIWVTDLIHWQPPTCLSKRLMVVFLSAWFWPLFAHFFISYILLLFSSLFCSHMVRHVFACIILSECVCIFFFVNLKSTRLPLEEKNSLNAIRPIRDTTKKISKPKHSTTAEIFVYLSRRDTDKLIF